jgi:RNA polymerase sigma-70 factor (ECF subfamily)
VAGAEEFSVGCIHGLVLSVIYLPKVRKNQSKVGSEPSNITPPLDADAGVRGEVWAGDLQPLVKAIAQGEAAALTRLYDATVGKVVAVARAVLHNVEDAEEVTCDVYTQVWRTAHDFDAIQGSVQGWLLTIARNRSIDMLRQRQSRQRAFATEQAPEETPDERVLGNPEDVLGLFQSGMMVHTVLAALSPLRRELVGMAFFRGLSHAQIAAETGLPVGTVKSHIRRALDVLREALDR